MNLEKENSGDEAVAINGNFESGYDILSRVEDTNGTGGSEPVTVESVKDTELANLIPVAVMVTRNSESGSPLVSPGRAMKGKGLRKWRRIKREATKEGNLDADNKKLLKRGLANVGVQPGKQTQFPPEMRQISELSVSSSNEVLRSPGGLLDGFVMIDDSGLVMAPVFAAGAESENKEDSLSSTTNVPKMKDGESVIAGNCVKSSSGKSSSGLVQKVQQGKTMASNSKKFRGQVRIEKQNSYSSMESDFRSPNVFLIQDNNYAASRGRQNGRLTNYAGENGEQAHGQGSDRFRTSYESINGREFEALSQSERSVESSQGVEEENRAKQEPSTDPDPLIDSIHILQFVQEALEKEVQRFRKIGNEDILASQSTPSEWTSVVSEVNDLSSSGEDGCNHSLHDLESEISSLTESAHLTKIKLEETTALLKEKEADISELEARLDVEAELESIFTGKIEAEVKYLIISKTIRDLRVASVNKISILERRIASAESQILHNLRYAESIDVKLRQGTEKLDCEDVCHDETLKLQSNIFKYALCLLLQLILLIVILGLLISQLSPYSTEIVPT